MVLVSILISVINLYFLKSQKLQSSVKSSEFGSLGWDLYGFEFGPNPNWVPIPLSFSGRNLWRKRELNTHLHPYVKGKFHISQVVAQLVRDTNVPL